MSLGVACTLIVVLAVYLAVKTRRALAAIKLQAAEALIKAAGSMNKKHVGKQLIDQGAKLLLVSADYDYGASCCPPHGSSSTIPSLAL